MDDFVYSTGRMKCTTTLLFEYARDTGELAAEQGDDNGGGDGGVMFKFGDCDQLQLRRS